MIVICLRAHILMLLQYLIAIFLRAYISILLQCFMEMFPRADILTLLQACSNIAETFRNFHAILQSFNVRSMQCSCNLSVLYGITYIEFYIFLYNFILLYIIIYEKFFTGRQTVICAIWKINKNEKI